MKDLGHSPTGEGHQWLTGTTAHLGAGPLVRIILASAGTVLILGATPQGPAPLTLAQAEALGLQNHPRILSAELLERADEAVVGEARAGFLPSISAAVTGALALEGTAVAAGALTTSSLSSRAAAGLSLSQLITDFGRTAHLASAARLREEAQAERAEDVRALVVLEVRRAYYQALAAEAVQRVANATLETRQLILRQVKALASNQLKSSLDVSFAEVLVSDAELAAVEAQRELGRSRAALMAAIGSTAEDQFTLEDEPVQPLPTSSQDRLVEAALRNRPDLRAQQLQVSSAWSFASAEQALHYPTLSLVGAAGVIPWHDPTLAHDTYAAAGLNIAVPIFSGGLFSARHTEADLRAQASQADLETLRTEVVRDVRTRWVEVTDAYQRLSVTAKLLDEATQALHLSRVRYDTGLGSIVELNQAQLLETSAAISVATSKYDYLARLAALRYATGSPADSPENG